MQVFCFDNMENTFGIKDGDKFKILKYSVYMCNINGNVADVYTKDGVEKYVLNSKTGEYTVEVI